jgi:hypothetical protein
MSIHLCHKKPYTARETGPNITLDFFVETCLQRKLTSTAGAGSSISIFTILSRPGGPVVSRYYIRFTLRNMFNYIRFMLRNMFNYIRYMLYGICLIILGLCQAICLIRKQSKTLKTSLNCFRVIFAVLRPASCPKCALGCSDFCF